MTDYFFLSWLDEPSVAVAEGPDDPGRDHALAQTGEIETWESLRLTVDSDELVDYLPNNTGVRLCSERIRRLVEAGVTSRDHVQWLPAEVVDIFGATHAYFVLHLPETGDLLNRSKSIMAGDFVVKPVIDAQKADGRQVFRVPEATLTLLVSDRLRQQLVEAGCTGIDFERAPVA